MDTKALAKSKRAHTLQQNKSKKPHPNKKPNKTPSTENKQKPQKSSLPSNWDRYGDDEEDEFGANLENPSGDNLKKPNFKDEGLVLPKSKGADFKHLLNEAQSKCHQLDNFPSLEDSLAEAFMPGVGPLLSVRGESILSWIGDDNFVVEDETISTHEASFLSLNLHGLAEQLAKVDISERLFIEADLLQTELGSNTSSSQEFDQMQTTESEEATQVKATSTILEDLAFEDFSEKNKAVNQNAKVSASWLTMGNSNPISFIQGSDVKNNSNSNQYDNSNQSTAPESSAQFNVSSVSPESRLPTFEAAAAESELDMLLDSLSETKLLDSSGLGSGALPISEKEAPAPPGSAKTTSIAATLDNVLDDFFEETSNSQEKEAATPVPLLSRNGLGSAKTTSTAATLDDVLDDLLEETYNLSNQNNLHQPSEMKAAHEIQSSSSQSVSESKALDDFDSWLDTI